MPEKRVRIPFPPKGELVDGSEVPVRESTERWTDVELEDGTKLRLKPTVVKAVRVDGQYDQEGNPMYGIISNATMVVVSSPQHLRKGAVTSTKAN